MRDQLYSRPVSLKFNSKLSTLDRLRLWCSPVWGRERAGTIVMMVPVGVGTIHPVSQPSAGSVIRLCIFLQLIIVILPSFPAKVIRNGDLLP